MLVVILHNAVLPSDSTADQDVLVQVDVVSQALDRLGHRWSTLPCTLDLGAARDRLRELRPDVVFNLVESLGGSDWLAHVAAGLLDTLGVPYTGAPTEAIFLSNHKLLTKQRLREAGLPTPGWIGPDARRSSRLPQGDDEPAFQPGDRYLLKTVCEHASFGLDEENIVRAEDRGALRVLLHAHAGRVERPCFAERFIEGREFNLSLLAGAQGPEVLPPAEIDFSAFPPGKPRIVGQRAKWQAESFEFRGTPSRFDFPPSDQPLLDQLRGQAEGCWAVIGLAGYGRVDFRVDGAGQPWILEVNTNPCLSPDAGFAAALAHHAIAFETAIQRILDDAPAGGWSPRSWRTHGEPR